MQLVLRFVETISHRYPRFASVLFALLVLGIDVFTGREIQFPLIYVLPVGFAAWRHQARLAYALAATLPVLRIGSELRWESGTSLTVIGFNAAVEVAAMLLYAFFVGRAAAQTTRLRTTVSTRDLEVSQLRAFTSLTGATLQGRGLSPGLVEGVVWIHLPPEELSAALLAIAPSQVALEIERLDQALAAAISELEARPQQTSDDMAAAESALLEVQLAILKDAEFWAGCKARVAAELIGVDQAVAAEIGAMAESFANLQHEVMRERATDIRDVGQRVLRNLAAQGKAGESRHNPLASLPPHTILVAEELLPSDMFQLDHANVLALVSERNSPASHVAILARLRNIPAVSDIKDATALLSTGDHLLVDGAAGTVIVAPTRVQSELFAERRIRHAAHDFVAADEAEPTTHDGVRIGLYANISRPDEAHLVSEYRLDGVGLFRSEFLFLDVDQPPTLDEQVAAYSAVARTLDPSAVVICTMDFGGDKIPRFHSPESELAFRMGKRGLAFSLAEKNMFRCQLQAILKSAALGDVRIMFPMVTGVAGLREARLMVAEAIAAEQFGKRISIGAMIETPAAVIQIHEIVKMVDFVSIGTNDLTDFILAIDRRAQETPGAPAFLHPSVLRATQHVVRTALNQGIGLSVCGEAAGNPAAVCLLLGMGVRNLSLNPFKAARIRGFLRQMTLEAMEEVTRDALAATTFEQVRQITDAALPSPQA